MNYIEIMYDDTDITHSEEPPIKPMLINLEHITNIRMALGRVHVDGWWKFYDDEDGGDAPSDVVVIETERHCWYVVDKSYEEVKRILLSGGNLIKSGGFK